VPEEIRSKHEEDAVRNAAAAEPPAWPASGSVHDPDDVLESSADAARPPLKSGQREFFALAVAAAGWLLPGLGHAVLKMWGRAVALFFTVALLVAVGAGMRGNIFTSNGEDAFSKLGYVADMGAGTFYFVARALETEGADVSRANGDYGTRLLATAGVLNLLAALHAYEAMRGRKA
jgi:hypothetical protein